MKAETFKLLEPIVTGINNIFFIDLITDLTGGVYRLDSCNTLWASPGYYVEIDAIKYKIIDIVVNESITIKGDTLPTATNFDMYLPFFVHGTILATNEELKAKQLAKNKFPMIYLHEITRERHYTNESTLDRESDCDIYFLVDADFESWLTNDHYSYAIAPMRNLLFAFIDSLSSNLGLIANFESFETFDHAKFGVYMSSQGHTKNIFDDRLSGTNLKITVPFLKNSQCSC